MNIHEFPIAELSILCLKKDIKENIGYTVLDKTEKSICKNWFKR